MATQMELRGRGRGGVGGDAEAQEGWRRRRDSGGREEQEQRRRRGGGSTSDTLHQPDAEAIHRQFDLELTGEREIRKWRPYPLDSLRFSPSTYSCL